MTEPGNECMDGVVVTIDVSMGKKEAQRGQSDKIDYSHDVNGSVWQLSTRISQVLFPALPACRCAQWDMTVDYK